METGDYLEICRGMEDARVDAWLEQAMREYEQDGG